jgi:hypothetical protein
MTIVRRISPPPDWSGALIALFFFPLTGSLASVHACRRRFRRLFEGFLGAGVPAAPGCAQSKDAFT